ncbi:hypothetical protein B0H13DRAFT_2027512 [Mycena leptocephala]|nr:hypothetical protein B0H13DRAFT_2027512 [Mycena leptocephala]
MRDLEKQEEDLNLLGTEEACAKMWSVYISQAEKYDKALVAGWRADMKAILIFTSVPAVALEFIPTMATQICNGLWFTALGLSLASAMLATLVEQWARDYLNKSDMLPSPIERARICSYLYSGLKRFRMHAIVDLIPLLLHMSLLLFFAGLVVFLYPINWAMMLIAASLLSIVSSVYAALTIMPLLVANCPCRTPLSGVLWRIRQICIALLSVLCHGVSSATHNVEVMMQSVMESDRRTERDSVSLSSALRPGVFKHTMEAVMIYQATAESDRRTERDKRALCWTLKSLTTEHELEPFVEAIPQHDHLLQTLIDDPGVQLGPRIAALLHTCENGLLEEGVRQHRTVVCLEAMLAFAMTAGVGPHSLTFPFEHSIFTYLSTTDYAPAQTYIPTLRACGVWSLFCSFLGSVERLIVACDAEIDAKRDPRIDLLLPWVRKAEQCQQEYRRARDSSYLPGPWPLTLDNLNIYYTYSPNWSDAEGLGYMRKTLQRLLDSKSSVQLAIFRNFLLDSARSKHEPYNFEEAVEILRPKTLSDSGIMLQNPGSTFCAIVDRFKNNANVNHIDRSIAVYLPLLDDVMDAEIHNCATDALIAYINGRDLPDAVLHVLRDCNVKEVWGRVTRRLSRRDQLDDVLTAIWRLCDLFMDSRFSALLGSIPLPHSSIPPQSCPQSRNIRTLSPSIFRSHFSTRPQRLYIFPATLQRHANLRPHRVRAGPDAPNSILRTPLDRHCTRVFACVWPAGQQLPKLPEVEDEAEDTPARVEIVPPE